MICYSLQDFIKIELFFTEIWRYNDFQDSSRSPCRIFQSSNIVTHDRHYSQILRLCKKKFA